MAVPLLALLLGLATSPAQVVPDTLVHLPGLGSATEDRIRVDQLTGDRPVEGLLIRSASSLLRMAGPAPGERHGPLEVRWLQPELRSVWNSTLPHSMNEGALWAGRGLSTRLTLGFEARLGSVTLLLAPHFLVEQNRPFQTVAYPEGSRTRSPWASPFHYPPASMDLPQRFGEGARVRLDAGQSVLAVTRGAVRFGAATENVWWGPGIRNALLMGAQAPGIPHLFVESAAPIDTPLGDVRFRWMLGRLSESDYFDFDSSNDHRSLSGFVVALTPPFDPGLSIGLARTVFAPGGTFPIDAALDVFRDVGRPAAEPGDTLLPRGPDQLFSVFTRWVFPGAGFEIYGEWGRYEQPRSFRDFVELPQHSRGYTVGLQYVRPLGERRLRLQSELTSLEPSQSFRVRQLGEWYGSRRVPQGYTHHGRVIGAAIGPSGSSQWIAVDLLSDGWSVGGTFARIRWENQALYTYFPEYRRADVSLIPGLRLHGPLGPVRITAEYGYGMRLNYLFQATELSPTEYRGVDLLNHSLAVTLSVERP